MIAIRSNFFYTRSVPCELWFYDRGKPKEMQDKILMIDARNVHRKVTRKIFDFSPEQLSNLSSIVWLYRGEPDKYLSLVRSYFQELTAECSNIPQSLKDYDKGLKTLTEKLHEQLKLVDGIKGCDPKVLSELKDTVKELQEGVKLYKIDHVKVVEEIERCLKSMSADLPDSNVKQKKVREAFDGPATDLKALHKQIEHLAKLGVRAISHLRNITENNGELNDKANRKDLVQLAKDFAPPRTDSEEQTLLTSTGGPIRQTLYYYRQIHWLQERFPDAKLADVEGLVKLVSRKDVEKNDWSLTPGRYVGVAPQEEDEDFDFEERIIQIHQDLDVLNKEAIELAQRIQSNLIELSI
jgi:type I restriction enzyme M protein